MGDLSLLENLAIVLGIGLAGGLIARLLRQPIILGYLLSGIVIGPHGLGLVSEIADVETLATVGVVLLMFTLGIEFSLKTLKRIGNVATLGGVAQILITIGLGVAVGLLFDWTIREAVLFGFFIDRKGKRARIAGRDVSQEEQLKAQAAVEAANEAKAAEAAAKEAANAPEAEAEETPASE